MACLCSHPTLSYKMRLIIMSSCPNHRVGVQITGRGADNGKFALKTVNRNQCFRLMWSSHQSGAFLCEFCQGRIREGQQARGDALRIISSPALGTSRDPLPIMQQPSDTKLVTICVSYFKEHRNKYVSFDVDHF